MYMPSNFKLEDAALIEQVIEKNSFGTLVSMGEMGLQASHLPFSFDREKGILLCHMARANPQWREFKEDEEVLAIFQGSHGYISPRWYETTLAVPTWNYVAIHAYGTPRIIEDDDEVEQLLKDLVTQHESVFEAPWQLESPPEWQAGMRRAIVGFEMTITRLEAKAKMSQNRPEADIPGVISGLEANGQHELAAWVSSMNSLRKN